ncbi:MAG: hypothetical protein HY878_01650, partial [Deltaproteobacteria bacterium]|nr:hypothetical protein [Deltaproteobacteria bacterium]
KQEGIEVSTGELDSKVKGLANQRKVEPEVLKRDLEGENLLDVMKAELLEDKVFDFILSRTKR